MCSEEQVKKVWMTVPISELEVEQDHMYSFQTWLMLKLRKFRFAFEIVGKWKIEAEAVLPPTDKYNCLIDVSLSTFIKNEF